MTKFIYKARDRAGKLIEGVMPANTSREVVTALSSRDLIAVSVEEVKETVSRKKKVKERVSIIRSGIRSKDIAIFCRQMATMINAGVSVIEAVEDIAAAAINIKLKNLLKKVAGDIKLGSSLSEALKRHPAVFNRLFVSMIRAGEESGNLDIVLLDLSKYLEATVKLKRKIRAASTYPMFIVVFMFVVMAGLVLFLVPRFKALFLSLGAQLPLPTRIIMGISDMLIMNTPWAVLFLCIFSFAFYFIYKTRKGRIQVEKCMLAVPVMGMIITKVILTRFFQTLATLLKSGVDIVASLEIAGKVVDNLCAEDVIEDIRLRIMEGGTLSDEMGKHKIFPRITTRMTTIGEKSGKLDEMFGKISEYYDDEIDATVEGMSSLIEPVLILVLGVVVGIFVIALYLPVFKMAMGMVGP